MDPWANDTISLQQKPPFRAVFVYYQASERKRNFYFIFPNERREKARFWSLLLRFLENDPLAQDRVELCKLDFAFDGFLILPSPDNVIGLRRFEPEQAVL
jgi:hypothetical protein